MAKILAWLVLIFVVLLALRMINMRKARARAGAKPTVDAQAMVRCARCGVFLPRGDASPIADGYICADSDCVKQ